MLWLIQSSSGKTMKVIHQQLGELSSHLGGSRPFPRSHTELHPAGLPQVHPPHQREADWVEPPRPARWGDQCWEEGEKRKYSK